MPAKNSGTFGYPGGKTTIAPWIIDHFPAHDVYVEPFGGSASVLMSKPKSSVEVYNDVNSDCVAFFKAIKEIPDQLREWVQNTPYSRELYEEWRDAFNRGERPTLLRKHAGRFWYLTTASFGSDIMQGGGTFSVNTTKPKQSQYGPVRWQRKGENIEHIRNRFHHVQIEQLDFTDVFNKYDSEDTFFYCDPPYVDVGEDYYTTGDGFDHATFCEALAGVEGRWLVSYGEHIPNELTDYHTVTRTKEATMSKQRPEIVERLIMNYDPTKVPMFRESDQQGLEQYD